MLFQGGALFDSLTIWENIAFRLLYAEKVPRKAREGARDRDDAQSAPRARVRRALSDRAFRRHAKARRASPAPSSPSPEIIFFDEPTTGLDPITADAINDLIVEMVKDLGCAAVSITHDMASARKIADEIAMLYDGKIIWRGMAGAIDQSGDGRVEQFIHGRADGPIQAIV